MVHCLLVVLFFFLLATVQAIPYCDITQQQFRDYFVDSDPTFVYFTDYADRISVTLNHLPESRSFPGRTIVGTHSRVISIAIRTQGSNPLPVSMGIQVPALVTEDELITWVTATFFIKEVQTGTYFQFGGVLGSPELNLMLKVSRQLVTDDRSVEVQRSGGVEFEERRVVEAVGGRGDQGRRRRD